MFVGGLATVRNYSQGLVYLANDHNVHEIVTLMT